VLTRAVMDDTTKLEAHNELHAEKVMVRVRAIAGALDRACENRLA